MHLGMSVMMFASYLQMIQENNPPKNQEQFAIMLAIGDPRVECIECPLTSHSTFL